MLSRRDLLLSTGAAAATLAAPAFAAEASDADAKARLRVLFDRFFTEELAESPEMATSLGLDVGPNAAMKSKLEQASLADVARRKRLVADDLAQLRAVDRRALSGMDGVNYDCVLYSLTAADAANRRFPYGTEGGSSPYVLSQITGAYQDVPDFLASQHTIANAADAEAYVARLSELARLMDQECERVRHDVGLGVIPPDFVLTAALGQMHTLRAPPESSSLVASLVDRTRAAGIPGDWQGQATRVYAEKVVPALDRQIALLQSLQPRAVHDAGVWRLPDGEAYYAQALADQTTTTMTPQEVHALGLDTARELTARADVLFRKLGMTNGTVAERYQALFKDPRYVYPNTDAGKAREIADLNKLVQDMQRRLPAYFATLPKAGLEIRRIPPATEAGASTHYTNGSLDGSRPGIYWLNLRDTAEAPFWDMPTTTYHEGIPGHHLQQSLQRETDLPMIRKASDFNAYAEGWALYAEQLAQEMGVYEHDPVGELGYVHDALLRAGRLVTDTGIHAMRWSREQASATLCGIDGDPPALATQEIERYAVWPGQACGYMVGKVSLLRLRAKARQALGPRFDIRKFHDVILLSGAMPITVLEQRVNGWIASQTTA